MYQTFPATDELAPYIECYWRWVTDDKTSGDELILPDVAPELIIHLGETPMAFSGGDWKNQPRAFVYCAAKKCLQLRISQPMDVFAIRFRPWGLSRFCSTPMSELLDKTVLPNPVLGDLGDSLVQAVRKAGADAERVRDIEEQLVKALEIRPQRAESLAVLVEAVGEKGNPAQALANGLARSPRSVRRVWRELVGISPRAYAKLMRVHRALGMIREGQPLVAVALDCGYSDQAHMARHIKEIAGLSPSQLKSWLGESTYEDLYRYRPKAPWRRD